ncbi:hypothetical protein IFM89_021481 [Coptis chinensis]|uniref:BZIP domain-containing protein n=1 Tax=Coptis chinensis TaxID=261450 RepID=A0A835M9J5_9MAGN|nr:hypothetical protein IFM89_021481 [Coptis chinensis]
MWSSGGEEIIFSTTNNSNQRTSSFSKSSSSSSYQSQSPFSASSPLQTPRTKTMEEVWEDIGLSSVDHHPTREALGRVPPKPHSCDNHYNPNTFRGNNLQEFLARPFSSRDSLGSSNSTHEFRHFGSSPTPTPPTALCLNSVPEFHYLDNTSNTLGPLHSQLDNQSNDVASSFGTSFNSPFDVLGPCSAFSPFGKKRDSESEDNVGDRRSKRMIKNRESAARSRSRKQAYTNELENKVERLTLENERLKQQEQVYLAAAAAAAQLPKRHMLQRTSTAPF